MRLAPSFPAQPLLQARQAPPLGGSGAFGDAMRFRQCGDFLSDGCPFLQTGRAGGAERGEQLAKL